MRGLLVGILRAAGEGPAGLWGHRYTASKDKVQRSRSGGLFSTKKISTNGEVEP